MIPRLVFLGMVLWVGLSFGADLPLVNAQSAPVNALLPDSDKTPGVADQSLTAEVLCAKRFTTRDVRNVTTAMKREVYALYGRANHKGVCAKSKRGCEVDHLISLELGGANDVKNLWPEPFSKTWGAEVKDQLENKLHKLVCAGEIDLATAQQEISTDWIASYKKHMQ